MGETKINVSEHRCSWCEKVFGIQEFPHPEVVWWCRPCWKDSRTRQKEKKRERRHAKLKEFIFRPRPQGGWSARRPYRSKGGLAALSPHERYLARHEFGRLVADCKRRGHTLTPKKRASLMANAIFIVKYVRTGKAASWRGNYWKRVKRLNALDQERQLEDSKARPIGERHGFTGASLAGLYGRL